MPVADISETQLVKDITQQAALLYGSRVNGLSRILDFKGARSNLGKTRVIIDLRGAPAASEEQIKRSLSGLGIKDMEISFIAEGTADLRSLVSGYTGPDKCFGIEFVGTRGIRVVDSTGDLVPPQMLDLVINDQLHKTRAGEPLSHPVVISPYSRILKKYLEKEKIPYQQRGLEVLDYDDTEPALDAGFAGVEGLAAILLSGIVIGESGSIRQRFEGITHDIGMDGARFAVETVSAKNFKDLSALFQTMVEEAGDVQGAQVFGNGVLFQLRDGQSVALYQKNGRIFIFAEGAGADDIALQFKNFMFQAYQKRSRFSMEKIRGFLAD